MNSKQIRYILFLVLFLVFVYEMWKAYGKLSSGQKGTVLWMEEISMLTLPSIRYLVQRPLAFFEAINEMEPLQNHTLVDLYNRMESEPNALKGVYLFQDNKNELVVKAYFLIIIFK